MKFKRSTIMILLGSVLAVAIGVIAVAAAVEDNRTPGTWEISTVKPAGDPVESTTENNQTSAVNSQNNAEGNEAETVQSSAENNVSTARLAQNEQTTTPAQDQSTDTMLTLEEAIEKALAVVDGRIDKIELEKERRKTYYEFEIRQGDYEYDIDIDAYTGELLKKKMERERGDKLDSTDEFISIQDAVQIAVNHVGEAVLDEVERDREDGRMIFEVELDLPNGDVEIEIDAITGEILDVDYD